MERADKPQYRTQEQYRKIFESLEAKGLSNREIENVIDKDINSAREINSMLEDKGKKFLYVAIERRKDANISDNHSSKDNDNQ